MKKNIAIIILLLALSLSGFYAYYNYTNKATNNQVETKQDKLSDFPKEIITMLEEESYKTVEPFYITTYVQDPKNPALQNPKKVYANGIVALKVHSNKADRIYTNLYQKLKNKGYLIFLTNYNYDDEDNMIFDVAVIKGTDQYDIVKLIKPSSATYKLTTKDIISKLQEWEKTVPFQIMVADIDSVEAMILKMPDNVEEFAKKTVQFAPDVITNEETVADLATDIKKYEYFWLYWK